MPEGDLSATSQHAICTPDWWNPSKIIGLITLKVTGKVTMTRHIRELVTRVPDREAGGSYSTWSRWTVVQGFLHSRTSGQHSPNPRTSLQCSLPPLHVEGLGGRRRRRNYQICSAEASEGKNTKKEKNKTNVSKAEYSGLATLFNGFNMVKKCMYCKSNWVIQRWMWSVIAVQFLWRFFLFIIMLTVIKTGRKALKVLPVFKEVS